MHLAVDGVAAKLATTMAEPLDFIYGLLDDLTGMIGAELLVPPQVVKLLNDGADGNDLRISGFAITTTGHVAMHAWLVTGKFSLCIYSCSSLNFALIHQWLIEELSYEDIPPEKMEVQLIKGR